MTAVKDENSVATMVAADSVTGLPSPIQIDPVTGRIMAEIYSVTTSVPVFSENEALKDENSVSTTTGILDSDSTKALTCLIDNRNGFLYADILQE